MSKKSNWKFVTSNGGSVSAGVVGAEGGSITLQQPGTKKNVVFYVGAIGVGLAVGVKLPKIGHITGGTGSSESFPSSGTVAMTSQFKGHELSIGDIGGGCMFQEIGAGLAWGHSYTALLFGMEPSLLAASFVNPWFWEHALETATGYVKFGGLNRGVQAGGGITQYVGVLIGKG